MRVNERGEQGIRSACRAFLSAGPWGLPPRARDCGKGKVICMREKSAWMMENGYLKNEIKKTTLYKRRPEFEEIKILSIEHEAHQRDLGGDV